MMFVQVGSFKHC